MTTNGAETDALRAQPERMLLLAAVPCALEVATIAGAAPFVFPSLGFDARWGLALGFVLADVSPAVCVPLLLDLQVGGWCRWWSRWWFRWCSRQGLQARHQQQSSSAEGGGGIQRAHWLYRRVRTTHTNNTDSRRVRVRGDRISRSSA